MMPPRGLMLAAMRKLLPALFVALAAPALASTPIDIKLDAGKIDEACMKLAEGDTLQWRFEADAPVAFNIHHHVGKDVLMPVNVKEARKHEGRLVADRANDWCLMWTAPKDRPAKVRGQWSTTAKP
jgi:hypothetical protein